MDEWMTNLDDSLVSMPLNQLAIPGSHDSGGFDLTKDYLPSAPTAIHYFKFIPGVKSIIANIIISLATTQVLTIGQQLNAGIRHLDFRVASKSNNFYFAHTVYGTKVSHALDEIKDFLDKHPKEVIILYIQQYHQFDSDKHKKFIALLKSKIGNKLLDEMDVEDVTLKYLWTHKKQIICIYRNRAGSGDKQLWTYDTSIQDPWPNNSDPDKALSLLTKYMSHASDVQDKFSVCQAVVTPDTKSVLSHLFSDISLRQLTIKHFNPVFMPWLADSYKQWDFRPNIVIKDFVEKDGYVQKVLALNKHRKNR